MTSVVPMPAMSPLLAGRGGRGGSPGKLGRAFSDRPAGSGPPSDPMLLSIVSQLLCMSAATRYKDLLVFIL